MSRVLLLWKECDIQEVSYKLVIYIQPSQSSSVSLTRSTTSIETPECLFHPVLSFLSTPGAGTTISRLSLFQAHFLWQLLFGFKYFLLFFLTILDRNFCFWAKFQSLFAAPSRRSTIGVKIGQKSHLSEKFQGFACASWNDFHFQFCLHFNSSSTQIFQGGKK